MESSINKIVVAISFSPYLETLLEETKMFELETKAHVYFVNVGKETQDKLNKLEKYIKKFNFDKSRVSIHFLTGDTDDAINDFCEEIGADLLLLKALDKESIIKYYMGSVSRKISRKAKCNTLLLLNKDTSSKFKRIVVDTAEFPKAQYSVNLAKFLAGILKSKEVFLVKEIHNPALTISMANSSTQAEATEIKNDLLEEEVTYIDGFCKEFNEDKIKVLAKTIQGKPGYAIRKFAKLKKADLLIVPAPDKQFGILDRLFIHDIEYILEELPCNVLIAVDKSERENHLQN